MIIDFKIIVMNKKDWKEESDLIEVRNIQRLRLSFSQIKKKVQLNFLHY